MSSLHCYSSFIFFFSDPSTTEIYTLSLHDALPIWVVEVSAQVPCENVDEIIGDVAAPIEALIEDHALAVLLREIVDRKSTRLNSSHMSISYAVFCLKKKTKRSNAIT